MFPLNVVLVGLGDDLTAQVRAALAPWLIDVEAECSDAALAVELFENPAHQPRLLVIRGKTTSDVDDVRLLTERLPRWPILAVVDAGRDAMHLLRLNRAGAGQLVQLPVELSDFQAALDRLAVQHTRDVKAGRVFAVYGATGGCGSTTVALNLACEIAGQYHRPTLLIELSLQLGVLSTYWKIEPQVALPELLKEVDRMDGYMLKKALTPVADNLHVLAGPQHLTAPPRIEPAQFLRLVAFARRLAEVVVLDVPCNYNDLQFEVLAAADEVVLVGEQTVPSVRGLSMIRGTFTPDKVARSLHLVLNRFDETLEGFQVRDLSPVLGAGRIATVAQDHLAAKSSINQGKPLRQVAPRSPALRDIDALARTLLAVAPPAAAPANGAGGHGLLSRMLGAFKR